MKVIFLDVDGVLNGLSTREPPSPLHAGLFLNPAKVALVNDLCERTGAAVVVSSSWRTTSVDLAKALRLVGATFRVVGATPNLDSLTRSLVYLARPRNEEIGAWLAANPTEAFVILDDDSNAEIAGHFIHVEQRHGLTEEDVRRAVEILGAERSERR